MKHGATNVRRWFIGALLLAVVGATVVIFRQFEEVGEFDAIVAALDRREFVAARELADARLKRRPRDVETLLLAAQATRRGGDLEAASRFLDSAERTGEMTEAVLVERNLFDLQTGRLDLANRYLEVAEAHPEYPESPLILESLIVGSLRRMDLRLAQRCVDSWNSRAKRDDERVQGQLWSGEIALRRGEVETATDHYRQVVVDSPDNDQARLRLAELLCRNKPTEALTHLEVLRAKRSQDRSVLLFTARSQRALGEHERAAELLDQILVKFPKDYEALLERGQLALELRQFDLAERRLSDAVRLYPERRDANLALARCLQSVGRDDDARPYREKVAQIDAELDVRMRRLREQGRLDE